MTFISKQLSSGKWGIYNDSDLLATVSSRAICETVIANLTSGRRDLPKEDANALYQISAQIRSPLKQIPVKAQVPTSASDEPERDRSAQLLRSHASSTHSIEEVIASLSEKQLEEALILAQKASVDSIKQHSVLSA